MQKTIVEKHQRLIVDAPPISPEEISGTVATAVVGRITLSIHRDLDELKVLWQSFEKTGICSTYQRFEWSKKWMDTAGKAHGATPYIVLGSLNDEPLFLFPFALICRGPFCVASWMGGSHSNFNMGIYNADFLKNVRLEDMRAIFRHIVTNAKDIDAFELCCQPMTWQKYNNPLTFLKRIESPNHAFSMQLAGSFDEVLLAHNAKKKRKKHRWQLRALEPFGGPKFIRAESSEEISRLLDAAFEQIRHRLCRLGVSNMFEENGIRQFFYDLAVSSIGKNDPSLVIYGLEVDGKIRATFAGGGHQGRLSGCFTSIAMDELTHTSPGELLLYMVIEDCTKRGFSSFDLGRGEERYKSSWCNEVVPMFESFIPASKKAVILIAFDRIRVTFKRFVKRNPKLWQFAKRVRAYRAGA